MLSNLEGAHRLTEAYRGNDVVQYDLWRGEASKMEGEHTDCVAINQSMAHRFKGRFVRREVKDKRRKWRGTRLEDG